MSVNQYIKPYSTISKKVEDLKKQGLEFKDEALFDVLTKISNMRMKQYLVISIQTKQKKYQESEP
jgi:hypothetical protein